MKKAILALAAMAISGAAVAGPKWTYIDAGYLRGDSGDDETEGYRLSGSWGFAEKWHVGAAFEDGEVEGGKGSGPLGADFDGYEIWAGVNPAITDNTDFVFDVIYFDGSIEEEFDDADTDGYGLRFGIRSMLTDQLELNAFAGSLDGSIDDGSSDQDFTDIFVQAGGQYFFTEQFSLGADVNVGDGNLVNLFARWSF